MKRELREDIHLYERMGIIVGCDKKFSKISRIEAVTNRRIQNRDGKMCTCSDYKISVKGTKLSHCAETIEHGEN